MIIFKKFQVATCENCNFRKTDVVARLEHDTIVFFLHAVCSNIFAKVKSYQRQRDMEKNEKRRGKNVLKAMH